MVRTLLSVYKTVPAFLEQFNLTCLSRGLPVAPSLLSLERFSSNFAIYFPSIPLATFFYLFFSQCCASSWMSKYFVFGRLPVL